MGRWGQDPGPQNWGASVHCGPSTPSGAEAGVSGMMAGTGEVGFPVADRILETRRHPARETEQLVSWLPPRDPEPGGLPGCGCWCLAAWVPWVQGVNRLRSPAQKMCRPTFTSQPCYSLAMRTLFVSVFKKRGASTSITGF